MEEYNNIPDFRNLNTKFGYNLNNLNTAYTYFKNMGLNNYLIASLLANGIAESGFNPRARNPKTSAKGIFLWLDGRYKYSSNDLTDDQLLMELLDYVKDTLNNTTDKMSWHHGGSGSGYNRAVDAYNAFSNADNLKDAVHSFTYGYNRPDNVALRERLRFDLALEIYNRFNNNDVSNTSQLPFSLSSVPEFLSKKYSTKPLFKKGGKAFVDGVSVLDSNPKAYKLVKKKYKMRNKGGLIPRALGGTLLNFWLKTNNFLNSDIGKGLLGIASKGISTIGNSIKQTNIANEFDKETDAQVKAMKNKVYNSAYSIGLLLAPLYLKDHDDVHYSDIDYRFFADMYAKGNLNINLIEEYKLNREKQKLELFSLGNYGEILLDGLGTLGLILGTPKKEDLTTNQLPAVVQPVKLVSSNDIKLDTRFTNPTWSAITSLTSGESELNYLNRIKSLWRV